MLSSQVSPLSGHCVPCPPEVTVGVGPGAWEGGRGSGVNALLFRTPPEEKSTADGVGGRHRVGSQDPFGPTLTGTRGRVPSHV